MIKDHYFVTIDNKRYHLLKTRGRYDFSICGITPWTAWVFAGKTIGESNVCKACLKIYKKQHCDSQEYLVD